MTKAKTDPKTYGLDLEQTFLKLTARLLSGDDGAEKQAALSTTISMLLQLVFQQNYRPATLYRCAEGLVAESDDATRRRVLEGTLNVLTAGIPELADDLALHALTAAITGILHKAGFTATEIAELVIDGRGGSPQQQERRARSRFGADVPEKLDDFWSTAFVKDNPGNPNCR
jgi:hypothetical protein